MPVSNIETLYDFETQLDAAFAAQVTAAVTPMKVYTLLSNEEMPVPNVRVQVNTGEAQGSGGMPQVSLVDGEYPAQSFDFTVMIHIQTRRAVDAAVGITAGKIRKAMSPETEPDLNSRLDYLTILLLTPQSTDRGVSADASDQKLDETLLTYQGRFGIRSDAYPLPPEPDPE